MTVRSSQLGERFERRSTVQVITIRTLLVSYQLTFTVCAVLELTTKFTNVLSTAYVCKSRLTH